MVVSLGRRLLALLYDTIALLAVLYFAAFIPVLASGQALVPGNPLFALYLVLCAFAYYWACWRRGRTLGMQAWKLEIVADGGGRPGTVACIRRFFAAWLSAALLGAGYLAALVHPARLCWHDRLSATRLVRH